MRIGTPLAAVKVTSMNSRYSATAIWTMYTSLHAYTDQFQEHPEEQPHISPGTLVQLDCYEIFNTFPCLLEGRPYVIFHLLFQ
jgi:hypothetical protein